MNASYHVRVKFQMHEDDYKWWKAHTYTMTYVTS